MTSASNNFPPGQNQFIDIAIEQKMSKNSYMIIKASIKRKKSPF
jgi:hypothetical protein